MAKVITKVLVIISMLFFQSVRNEEVSKKDVYSFSVSDAKGKSVSLEAYRGKVTLIVNVASECGFTDRHYKDLVRMQTVLEPVSHNKFSVLAFPCNQFGNQEPLEIDEIVEWAKNKYEVNFPIFNKINVIDKEIPDLWKFLADESGHKPNWNFWKYLVDPDGKVIKTWGPWSDVQEAFPDVKSAVDGMMNAQGPQKPAVNGRPDAKSKLDQMHETVSGAPKTKDNAGKRTRNAPGENPGKKSGTGQPSGAPQPPPKDAIPPLEPKSGPPPPRVQPKHDET